MEKNENVDKYADAVAKRLGVAADEDKLRERSVCRLSMGASRISFEA